MHFIVGVRSIYGNKTFQIIQACYCFISQETSNLTINNNLKFNFWRGVISLSRKSPSWNWFRWCFDKNISTISLSHCLSLGVRFSGNFCLICHRLKSWNNHFWVSSNFHITHQWSFFKLLVVPLYLPNSGPTCYTRPVLLSCRTPQSSMDPVSWSCSHITSPAPIWFLSHRGSVAPVYLGN